MLETEDLFLGAFALVRGGRLDGVTLKSTGGRPLAVFRIEGDGLEQAEDQYYSGHALVNPQLLKVQVRRLKDRAFDAIREEEKRNAGQQGRYRAAESGEPHRLRHR